jgi:sirohydrochlorin ferrochelatase
MNSNAEGELALPPRSGGASERRTALLLIAHGSRRPDANAELERVAESIRARARYPIVQISYLELAEPSIDEGAMRCVRDGATDLILLPYFLSPGKHVVEDLAAARDRLAARFPDSRFTLAQPLGSHPLVMEVVEERAREAESPDQTRS